MSWRIKSTSFSYLFPFPSSRSRSITDALTDDHIWLKSAFERRSPVEWPHWFLASRIRSMFAETDRSEAFLPNQHGALLSHKCFWVRCTTRWCPYPRSLPCRPRTWAELAYGGWLTWSPADGISWLLLETLREEHRSKVDLWVGLRMAPSEVGRFGWRLLFLLLQCKPKKPFFGTLRHWLIVHSSLIIIKTQLVKGDNKRFNFKKKPPWYLV